MRSSEFIKEMPAIAARTASSKPYQHPAGADGPLGSKLSNYVRPQQGQRPARLDRQTDVYAFPDPKKVPRGQFQSVEQLDTVVDRINKYVGGNLKIMNSQQRAQDPDKYLGFAVSYWVNDQGQRHAIGKYVYNTKNVKKGHGNTVGNYLSPKHFDAHDLGPELGYLPTHQNSAFDTTQYPGPASTKTTKATTGAVGGLEPKDIVGEANIDKPLSVVEIRQLVKARFGKTAPALVALTDSVIAGSPDKTFSVDLSNLKSNEVNKDFAELLHPLAFLSDPVGVSGYIPAGFNYSKAKIVYSNPSGSLSDSKLVSGNKEIFISSKYGGGTPPAMGGDFLKLLQAYDPLPQEQGIYDILKLISSSGQQPSPGNMGPLSVAVRLKLITPKSAKFISDVLAKDTATKKTQYRQLSAPLPTDLQRYVPSKDYRRGLQIYYVLMNRIMKDVENFLNSSPVTSDLIKKVLGPNFLTVKTSATETGNADVPAEKMMFTSVLADKSSKIKITTGTAYHSDHIKNSLQFTVVS